MAGWSRKKRETVEAAFFQFLKRCYVNSKDAGRICLGDNLYEGQRRVIGQIFDALEEDIHEVYVLKSRQLGLCLDPDTKVLTANLRWVKIADVAIGDELIGVDEQVYGLGNGRKFRPTVVEGVSSTWTRAFKITLDDGREVVCSGKHRWMTKKSNTLTSWRSIEPHELRGKRIKVGTYIRWVTKPWGAAGYEDGWFGGMLDGEGSISNYKRLGAGVNVSQKPGPVWDRLISYAKARGYSYRIEDDRTERKTKYGKSPVPKLCFSRMDEVLRLIGHTRPTRFIGKRFWEGRDLPGKKSGIGWAKVTKIEPLGSRRMIDLQTSTKTFIAEGFVSHNSTIVRALTMFLIGIHPGLKGAIVFDTAENKNESRAEIEVMINDLPESLKFPGIKQSNRGGLTLDNDSKVLFMAAGVRKTKVSGQLGRSVGLSLAHLSELCSYDNDEGLEAFRNSLSDINPNRLYIYESTARGFNSWWLMWEAARKDPHHCKCIFLGWWSKETQTIAKDHPDFPLYGLLPPGDDEIQKIKAVKELYGHEITVEQLAWIRRKMNPATERDGDAPPDFAGNPLQVQENPWTEFESFQQTGAVFFAPEKLTDQTNKFISHKYKTYMYVVSDEFAFTEVLKAPNNKMVELKVWEEPASNDGVYALAIDSAYGSNEYNDRSSIQVLRCYADGVDQVAEYASPLVTTQQLAWVIASLLGWYGAGMAEMRYILELNGPGAAVFNALKQLKYQIENGYQPKEVREKGLGDVFRNVKTYIYNRVDSMGAGANYHFVTNTRLKVQVLERLRDFVSNGMLRVRSMEAIDEMKTIARDGDKIGAPSSMHDDRVMALALAVHCWEEKIRRNMIAQKRTRDAEAARQRLSITDQVLLFQQNQLSEFFKAKNMARINQRRQMVRNNWRYR